MKVSEIAKNDLFSELTYYKATGNSNAQGLEFENLVSGDKITLSQQYVEKFLHTANQYEREEVVTKEDKKDGTLGIRSIFQSLNRDDVFTVVFTKQGKKKTKKAYDAEVAEAKAQMELSLENARKSKKSITDAAISILEKFIANPIQDFEAGEERTLIGYKKQFESRDGHYMCVELLPNGDTQERPVNINTISTLVVGGVRYVVK